MGLLRRDFGRAGGILCPSSPGGRRCGTVVYLDGIIALNFLIDLLLLIGVNRLSGHPAGFGRAAAGAAVGGGYAGMCMIPALAFLTSALWRGVSLLLVSLAAFGMNRSSVRRGVLFVLLSMALGGLVVSVDTGRFAGLVLSAGVLALLCGAGFRGGPVRRYLPVTVRYGARQVHLTALQDTGNTLTDPLTGESVLVISEGAARELTGLSRPELRDPVGTMAAARLPGLRLIPYTSVGKSGGFLLGVRCDEVRIGKENGGRLVALSPDGFSSGEYQALTGGQYG